MRSDNSAAGTRATPADQSARDRALDPTGSFIVQAPAGSGKTDLLIRRYLALLARVENPEEVVAVTFTRKAAEEMRARVLTALEDAPDVVARDAAKGWALRSRPARLRIQTIDALCASIVRLGPWRARPGGEADTVEDAEPLYRQAVHELLEILDKKRPEADVLADALARVLEFLDNDLTRFESTFVALLARRDRWLRHMESADEGDPAALRPQIIHAFESSMTHALGLLRASVPPHLSGGILTLAAHAGGNLAGADPGSPIAPLAGISRMPGDSIPEIPLWRGIAELLLTREGTWRARHTKKEGFPPASSSGGGAKGVEAGMKRAMAELMADLAGEDAFRSRLHAVRILPQPPIHTHRQWAVLASLITVLRLAATTLRSVFSRHGKVDFIEVAHGALAALDNAPDSAPDSNASQLTDYPIRHLLVDEFQDTSHTQVRLFTKLTDGWRANDGRTLFLVGDPMQSIYRFRQADVALYLRAQRFGIGRIPLEPLRLWVNFRSERPIIHWINKTFPSVFPQADEADTGAVSFHPSVAHKETEAGPGVQFHPFGQDQKLQEADGIVAAIRAAKKQDPGGSVAIIARGRAHLEAIIPRLDAEGIRYRGVELIPLIHRPAARDLLALTRALLHPGDRIAWLSVLRAPWCGLALGDLHALTRGEWETPILERVRLAIDAATAGASTISMDGRARLARVYPILDSAVRRRARGPLRTAVEAAWMALGGVACIATGPGAAERENSELADAQTFFGLIETLENQEGPPDGARITEKAARLYATPLVDEGADEGAVEIMTIHKAKGLEFDTVIVPGLGRGTRPTEKPLLAWMEDPGMENPAEDGGFHLMLAAMPDPGVPDPGAPEDGEAGAYPYLCHLEETGARHEAGRLLYVACTRARKRLHLMGHARLSQKTGQLIAPNRQTLLSHLWPVLSPRFEDPGAPCWRAENHDPLKSSEQSSRQPVPLWRLPADWTPPPAPAPLSWSGGWSRPITRPIAFPWTGHIAASTGTLIHRILRRLAEARARGETMERLPNKQTHWPMALLGLGIPHQELEPALARVMEAVERIVQDPRWHWIIHPGHHHAHNEYPLTGMVGGRLVNVVIDRTFVDAEGVRWIIDYKTGSQEWTELEQFLDREQTRYRDQLERYGALFSNREPRPVRAGLYFPLLGGWRAWAVGRTV